MNTKTISQTWKSILNINTTEMNTLQDIEQLVASGNLPEAIVMAEEQLKLIPTTEFHDIIGKDLLHHVPTLVRYISDFYAVADEELDVTSIYASMNAFTMEFKNWYIELFAFEEYLNTDNKDWEEDYEFVSEHKMRIKGFESLQEIFERFMEEELHRDQHYFEASEWTEYLVIMRLQELFLKAKLVAEEQNLPWETVSIIVGAQDYDLLSEF